MLDLTVPPTEVEVAELVACCADVDSLVGKQHPSIQAIARRLAFQCNLLVAENERLRETLRDLHGYTMSKQAHVLIDEALGEKGDW